MGMPTTGTRTDASHETRNLYVSKQGNALNWEPSTDLGRYEPRGNGTVPFDGIEPHRKRTDGEIEPMDPAIGRDFVKRTVYDELIVGLGMPRDADHFIGMVVTPFRFVMPPAGTDDRFHVTHDLIIHATIDGSIPGKGVIVKHPGAHGVANMDERCQGELNSYVRIEIFAFAVDVFQGIEMFLGKLDIVFPNLRQNEILIIRICPNFVLFIIGSRVLPRLFQIMQKEYEKSVGKRKWKRPAERPVQRLREFHSFGNMVRVPTFPCLVLHGRTWGFCHLIPMVGEEFAAIPSVLSFDAFKIIEEF